jgi:hypothetical protein
MFHHKLAAKQRFTLWVKYLEIYHKYKNLEKAKLLVVYLTTQNIHDTFTFFSNYLLIIWYNEKVYILVSILINNFSI